MGGSPAKIFTGYDFCFQPMLGKARIWSLAELKSSRCKVVHLRGAGIGKSHLASALGFESVEAGRSISFITLADLIGALAKAEREGPGDLFDGLFNASDP
jgi:DNA replication protein DnaC